MGDTKEEEMWGRTPPSLETIDPLCCTLVYLLMTNVLSQLIFIAIRPVDVPSFFAVDLITDSWYHHLLVSSFVYIYNYVVVLIQALCQILTFYCCFFVQYIQLSNVTD